MKLRGGTRTAASATAVLALLLVSGCGGMTPGTAATVNGARITDDQVNELAAAQCVAVDRAAKTGNSTTMVISRVKQQSLGLLMDTRLTLQYADDQGIKPEKSLSEGFYRQIEPSITPLSGKTRTVLTEVFQDWAKGRAILVQIGSRGTGQAPSPTNIDQLTNAGLQARVPWLKKSDLEVDPRYGPTKQGFPGGGEGSVSRASSDFAKSASAVKADPQFVSSLPASQKCG